MKQFWSNISPFNSRSEMPAIQYIIKIILVYLICFFGGQLIASAAVMPLYIIAGKDLMAGEGFDEVTTKLISDFSLIIVIILTLFFWKKVLKKPFTDLGIKKRFGDFFVGLGLGLVLLFVSIVCVLLTGTIKYVEFVNDANYPLILLFFAAFIIQCSMEEFVTRGLLLCGLKDKIPMPAAFGITAVLFALPHFTKLLKAEPAIVLVGTLNLILISVIFSFLLLKFDNIWIACGVHTAWNFLLFSFLGLSMSGSTDSGTSVLNMQVVEPNILNGGIYGIEASIIVSIVFVVGVVLTGLWYKKSKAKAA